MAKVGDKLIADHPYCYRPDGCENATVTHIGWDDEMQRVLVGVIYDNGVTDYAPLSDLLVYYRLGM